MCDRIGTPRSCENGIEKGQGRLTISAEYRSLATTIRKTVFGPRHILQTMTIGTDSGVFGYGHAVLR